MGHSLKVATSSLLRLNARWLPTKLARLTLFVLTYNLGNFLHRIALPKEVSRWSLRSIQLKHVKIGAKMLNTPDGPPSSAPTRRYLRRCSPLC